MTFEAGPSFKEQAEKILRNSITYLGVESRGPGEIHAALKVDSDLVETLVRELAEVKETWAKTNEELAKTKGERNLARAEVNSEKSYAQAWKELANAVRAAGDDLIKQNETLSIEVGRLRTQSDERRRQIERLEEDLKSTLAGFSSRPKTYDRLAKSLALMPVMLRSHWDGPFETIYQWALRLNGEAYQYQKTAEECAELAAASLQFLERSLDPKRAAPSKENLFKEIADVLFMLEVLALIFPDFDQRLGEAYDERDRKVFGKLQAIEAADARPFGDENDAATESYTNESYTNERDDS